MHRVSRLLQVLGVNSVPVVGFLAADWTGATALAVYWCENVMVTLLVGLRIWLHRRATGKRGHFETVPLDDGRPRRQETTFLAGFLSPALIFTAGHAVFLALILFLVLPRSFPEAAGVDLRALWHGVLVVAVFLAAGFGIDALRIEQRSFFWIRQVAKRVLGRVVLVHLTIIFGMFAMAWLDGPRGLFLVFAGFKTVADLGALLGGEAAGDPEPPRWLVAVMRRVTGARKTSEFIEFYREESRRETLRAAEWEKAVDGWPGRSDRRFQP